MIGEPSGFWGKLQQNQDNTTAAWHPLAAHCADVAACMEAILTRTAAGTRLAAVDGRAQLEGSEIARLSVLAAFHDIGKFCTSFQNKAFPNSVPTTGHVDPVLAILGDTPYPEQDAMIEALGLEDIATWGEDDQCALALLVAAICHHGKPKQVGKLHQSSWWRPSSGKSPFDGMRELAALARLWFPRAYEATGHKLPRAPEYHHLYCGLVMLADWLGSDTRHFPFAEDLRDRMPFARHAALEALRTIGLDVTTARELLRTERPSFREVFGFQPREAQKHVLTLDFACPASLTILEAETGSGKTEAAISAYLRLVEEGQVDGMYFALPTRTAATQIYARVVKAVESAFRNSEFRPPVVLAVPGYLSFDNVEGRRLAGFEVLWNDDPYDRSRFRGWAAEHPKRYLAGSVVVGTIDQVLLSTVEVSHAHMRAAALSRLLLVIDEVHASDAYMTRLTEAALTHHFRAKGHAFLMSATLGSAAKSGLLRARGEAVRDLSVEEAIAQPYPAVTHAHEGVAHSIHAIVSATERSIFVRCSGTIDQPVQIAEQALNAARQGARVIVLRNTVTGCAAVQQALEELASDINEAHLLFRCAEKPAPHHSRFSKEDRNALDRAIEGAFGKVRPSGGCVVVATQTIQQSLDLDADFMLTDISPMDVWLQRVGRLHRHSRAGRPGGFEDPTCVLLTPAKRDIGGFIAKDGEARGTNGLGTVYSDLRIIEATWRLLETRRAVLVPDECRKLVELTTHPVVLSALAQQLGGPWLRHENRVVGATLAHKRLATLNLLDFKAEFGAYKFPDSTADGRISTRLGEGDRIVCFPETMKSPFGEMVRQITLPSWLATGVAHDAVPSNTSNHSGRWSFSFGPHVFIYDRLGLRRSSATSQVEEDLADA